MLELIIFDWDGTLVDSAARIVRCFERAALDLDLPPPEAERVRDAIGLSLPIAFEQVMPGVDESTRDALVARYREHFIHRDDTAMPFFPGVSSGVQALYEAGYLLAIATGKARRGLDRGLTGSAIERCFAATRCADEAPSKPHPQMVFDVLAQTRVGQRNAVMVGDTVYDLEMASNAGIRSLAVSYGAHARERLDAWQPEGVADSFEEVVAWLLERGPMNESA